MRLARIAILSLGRCPTVSIVADFDYNVSYFRWVSQSAQLGSVIAEAYFYDTNLQQATPFCLHCNLPPHLRLFTHFISLRKAVIK